MTAAGVAMAALLWARAQAIAQDAPPPRSFPVARLRFEQNATDGDVEVVFEVTGRAAGLATLTVNAPDGRPVIHFTAPDRTSLGMRKFLFESPEPKDVPALKAAYPEGEYSFTAVTVSGERLAGRATLNHQLPPTSEFVWPRPKAMDVPIDDLEIKWSPVDAVTGYIFEIEQASLDMKIVAKLPAAANSFTLPAKLIRPGVRYQIGIGTVSSAGNISFIETQFTTAVQK
jgi:hypothetical protein